MTHDPEHLCGVIRELVVAIERLLAVFEGTIVRLSEMTAAEIAARNALQRAHEALS